MPLTKAIIFLVLCCPDLPVPDATPARWEALRSLSADLELTTPGVEGWSDWHTEIGWHRRCLHYAADLPPLAFAAGLPAGGECQERLVFADHVYDHLCVQAAACPAHEGEWGEVLCDQRRRIDAWRLASTAVSPDACALYRRKAIADLWELTGGVLPCHVAAESFRRLP